MGYEIYERAIEQDPLEYEINYTDLSHLALLRDVQSFAKYPSDSNSENIQIGLSDLEMGFSELIDEIIEMDHYSSAEKVQILFTVGTDHSKKLAMELNSLIGSELFDYTDPVVGCHAILEEEEDIAEVLDIVSDFFSSERYKTILQFKDTVTENYLTSLWNL